MAPERSEFKWSGRRQETSLEICGCQCDRDSKVNISCCALQSQVDLLL